MLDRAERRSYREYQLCETERQADFTPEKFTDEKYVLQTDLIRTNGYPEERGSSCVQSTKTLAEKGTVQNCSRYVTLEVPASEKWKKLLRSKGRFEV